MKRTIGACTLHLWEFTGILVVHMDQDHDLDRDVFDVGSWVEASWDASVRYLHEQGWDVIGDDPVVSNETVEVYVVQKPHKARRSIWTGRR